MSTDDSPEREFNAYDREGFPNAPLEDVEGTLNVSESEDMLNPSNSTDNPKSLRTPRREVWWLDLGTKNQSLELIKQRFEDCLDGFLLSSFNSPLRHITSPVDNKLRDNLHQCPGYLREEITLACDVSKSAIISHTFPSQSEVCSICGQLVQYKNTEPPIVDGEMQEPSASPQSDVRKMVTPSLMDKFSPCSPDLTPQDSTMDTPLFDSFPIPGSEDVQGREVKAKSPPEPYPSSLNLMTPTSPRSLFDSHHLPLLQPSGISSPYSPVVDLQQTKFRKREEDIWGSREEQLTGSRFSSVSNDSAWSSLFNSPVTSPSMSRSPPPFNDPSSQLSDMSDSSSILIPPSPTRSNHSRHRFMTTLLHNNRPEDAAKRERTPLACTNCRSRILRVSKPSSKLSYPSSCSHYPSVVHSIQLKVTLVSDVIKKEFSLNIVPLTTIFAVCNDGHIL